MPDTHASQLVIPSPEKPGLQVQSFTDTLPGIELAFPAHNLQLELPGISWYVPTWHVLQDEAPDASAYVPAGHSAHASATLQTASNPAVFPYQLSRSDSNNTCINPVDDMYGPVLGLLPDNRATSSNVLHDDEVQRLIVTQSPVFPYDRNQSYQSSV